MANDNAPRGLEPLRGVGGYIPTNRYRVNASNSTIIYIGDPVVRASAGTVDLATAGAGNYVLGSVLEIIAPADQAFENVGIPATGGALYGTYEVVVADDPEQLYVMQEDGDTTDLALTGEGANVDLVSGTGSTVTGLSGWQLDSDTVATSASIQMRIIRMLQDPKNAIGDYCRWIVKINYHQALQASAGTGI